MRSLKVYSALFLILLIAFSCTPEDKDRCGDGFIYLDGGCFLVGGQDTGEIDCGDAGMDAGPPEGMGETCYDQSDCAGFESSYCLLDAMSPDEPGMCTISDCTTDPDSCPCPWFCCDFIDAAQLPNTCIPMEMASEMGGYCQ